MSPHALRMLALGCLAAGCCTPEPCALPHVGEAEAVPIVVTVPGPTEQRVVLVECDHEALERPRDGLCRGGACAYYGPDGMARCVFTNEPGIAWTGFGPWPTPTGAGPTGAGPLEGR